MTRAIGRLAYATWRSASSAASPQDLGVEPERVTLDHVGLNHLSWITAVTVDGTDRLPEILEAEAPSIASMVRLPVEQILELGAVPSYYLRYYYAFDEVLAEQRAGHKRAEEVIDLERQLLEMYADPALDTKPDLLNHRGGAFYSEAAAQLLASLHDGAGDTQVVDLRNGTAIDGLDATDVVEVSVADRSRRRDSASPARAPAEMLELIQAAKAYEHLADQRRRDRRSRACPPGAGGQSAGRPAHRRCRPAADRPARGQPPAPAAVLRGLMPNAARAAQPGPTRMRREIGQIPAVVARVLSEAPHDLQAVAAAVRQGAATLRRDRGARHVRSRRQLRPVPDGDPPRAAHRPGQAVDHDHLRAAAALEGRAAAGHLPVGPEPGHRGRGLAPPGRRAR